MRNIWEELSKPIFCLAPMEDVTDTAFRRLLVEIGKPVLMFSEFLNLQGIYSHSTDQKRLEYTQAEKPLILQVWGMEPELYYNAGRLAFNLGYDGLDINMGCPQKKIIKKGACSALIKNRSLADEIISAAVDGCRGLLPLSVKTRIGFDSVVTEDWTEFLLKYDLAALTVHGRTSKQLSQVPADWDEIGKVVAIRNSLGKDTLILGNGDVQSLTQAKALVDLHGVDGVMIGRGIFHDPWLFNPNESRADKTVRQKLETLVRHVEIWTETWPETNDFNKLKRFFKIYCTDFPEASQLRTELMETKNLAEVKILIDRFLSQS